MATEYIDLLLDNGEIVRVEVPTKYLDECWESILQAMKTADWWAPEQWDGCHAQCFGVRLGRVNAKRIIGTL